MVFSKFSNYFILKAILSKPIKFNNNNYYDSLEARCTTYNKYRTYLELIVLFCY